VQCTVFVPTGKMEPDGGVTVTARLDSQMSLTTGGANVTTAPPESRGFSAAMMFDGQTMVGGVVSTTVTVKLHAFELAHGSTAKQLTVFVPSVKNEPDAGTQ
jgi:hypothetical protein